MSRLLTITDVFQETDRIRAYELRDPAGADLPEFEPGAHISVHLGNGLTRQYSLANDPADRKRYLLGVLHEPEGRGGSAWIFDNWAAGTSVRAEAPVNCFALNPAARFSLLIAAGIGITPILPMAHALQRQGQEFSLHYCTRSPEDTAFLSVLRQSAFADRVRIHHDNGIPGRGLDLGELLQARPPGGDVYTCGPQGFVSAVRQSADRWPNNRVHFELFAADEERLAGAGGQDRPFQIEIASTGQVVDVPAGRTAISVLSDHGIDLPKLCEQGVCGSCLTGVRSGMPDHRDSIQSDAERASNLFMTPCCSRARSDRLVLDL